MLVTKPVVDIVVTPMLLLLHVPPAGELLSCSEAPWHSVCGPLITVGVCSMVTDVLVAQPPGIVYEITVMPGALAVKTPDGDITATAELLLLHMPLLGEQLSVAVVAWHTAAGAVIAVGIAVMFTKAVAAQPLDIV